MPRKISEKYDQRLIEAISHLHSTGMGYRKMGPELESRGFPRMGKDKIRRLHLQASPKDLPEEIEDNEIRRLKQLEKEKVESSRIAKEKRAIRIRIKDLEIEKVTLQFKKRKKIFTDEKAALRFLSKVMPIIDALLWDQFLELCAKRNYKLSNEALLALGRIEDFEEMLRTNGKSVDKYLSERLRSSMNAWQEEHKTEEGKEETIQASEEHSENIEECSDDTEEYIDDEGYVHIPINRPEGYPY